MIVASLAFAGEAVAQSGPAAEQTPPAAPPSEPSPRAGQAQGEVGEGQARSPTREGLPSGRVLATQREESQNPFRQSTLTFDQSMTTQTAGLGPAPQSYVPLYEIWLSFRPRYFFDEHLSLRGRFDYTKELTNSQATTLYREDVFGDIWTDLVYSTKVDHLWQGTKASVGLRALWPTSKVSQANGTYLTPGIIAGAEHKFEIRGEDASVLNDLRIGVSFRYLKPLTAATTPTSYGGFAYTRQNVDGFSFISDQIAGQTVVNHTLWGILETVLQITPRLSFTGDLIVINEWHYPPSPSHLVASPTDDHQFIQTTWLVAYVDYALFDELDLSLGYYNLANYVAPSGQTRSLFGSDNIWWSPDARLFFDVTANLDVLFDDARHHKYAPKELQPASEEHVATSSNSK